MTQVAIGIKTNKWNEIIAGLKREGWRSKNEYGGFDKGIDFDFLELRKGTEKITFAWDNWFEGELRASEELIKTLEARFDIKFKHGTSEHLSPSQIEETIKRMRR